MTTDVNNLVFIGLNSRVAALDQHTGQLVWQWRATTPRSGGYVSLLLLDDTRLIVSPRQIADKREWLRKLLSDDFFATAKFVRLSRGA